MRSCHIVSPCCPVLLQRKNVLGSVCAVVHEEEINFADVVDEESLVAGWHHVAGLLVGSVSDL